MNDAVIEVQERLASEFVTQANESKEGTILRDFYSECAANALRTANMLRSQNG